MENKSFLEEILLKKEISVSKSDYGKILSEFEQFLQYIFSSVQDGISILDKDLRILGTNPTMDNWFSSKKPYLGKKCFLVYHDRTRPCKNCPTLRTIQSKKSNVSIIKYKISDIKEGWHELFSFPLFNDRNEIIAVIEYVRDITLSQKTKKISEKLKKRLMLQDQTLQEQETALKVLFNQRDQRIRDLEKNVIQNVSLLVNPLIEELKIKLHNRSGMDCLLLLENYLKNLTEPLITKVSNDNLTPKQVLVASLIRKGMKSREIADFLGLSIKAVEFHRLSIRKKMGLKKSSNLQTFLQKN
jgi:DNA-binding CsgD family transcriptional regulator